MKKLPAIVAIGLAALVAIAVTRAGTGTPAPVHPFGFALPDLDRSQITGRFAQALRFPTVSTDDPADRDAIAFDDFRGFVATTFPLVDERLEHIDADADAIVLAWRGSDSAATPALLLAHFDVVPAAAATLSKWHHPPFAGTVADGTIWGRGAMDDKLGVMGILEATEHLLRVGFTPTRTLYFAFGADEEVGGGHGAARVAEFFAHRGLRFESVLDEGLVITDGILPGVTSPVALVGIAEKGYVSLALTADGKGGHSSMPPQHTTVGILSRAIHRLEEAPFPARLTAPSRRLFATLAPHMGFARRLLLSNLWLTEFLVIAGMEKKPSGNALVRTTTAVTMFAGGVKENVLPTTARAVVNFRILPGETYASVKERTVATIDDPRVAVEIVAGMSFDPSPISSDESPAFIRLRRTIETVYPAAIVAPSLVVGATDSRHFQAIADDVYRFNPETVGPTDLVRIHGIDERLGVDDYVRAVQFYATFLRACGDPTTR